MQYTVLVFISDGHVLHVWGSARRITFSLEDCMTIFFLMCGRVVEVFAALHLPDIPLQLNQIDLP